VNDRLFDMPICGGYPIDVEEANRLLIEWNHKLGPVERPFRQEAFGLEICGKGLIAVAVSGSIINGPISIRNDEGEVVRSYDREEVVELTRLASNVKWANRIMIRAYRELLAPAWKCWPVKAVVSYSKNEMHSGNTYRFDGWAKINDNCGARQAMLNRGKRRYGNDDPRAGSKSLWIWEYQS